METRKVSGTVRVGTSGYQYPHWRGVFYPDDVPKSHWFEFFAKHFDAVEINNTFYNLPATSTFEKWAAAAPEGFCYTLKFSRYGSHIKRLKDPGDTIGLFLEHSQPLGEHQGPILVQLPPHWHRDTERLAQFLDEADPGYRWAVEFRDPEWLCEEVFGVLREHNAALCIHDMIDDHPREITSDWVYLRYHGGDTWGSYPDQALSAWADWIVERLDEGLDVHAYFNNDAHGYAIDNAKDLRRYIDHRIQGSPSESGGNH